VTFASLMRSYAEQQIKFLREQEAGRRLPANGGNSHMRSEDQDDNLPISPEDGFNQPLTGGDGNDTIIGMLLKCVDGHWTDRDDVTYPAGTQLLALGCDRVIRCWREQKVIAIKRPGPNQSFGDLCDQLNEAIPRSEWELDLNGEPRPPWQITYVIYLISEKDAERYTFANWTTGARIAYETLVSKVSGMRAMRGAHVVPVVELSSKPMKTRFGTKMRPDFKIIEWRDLSGGRIGSGGGSPSSLPKPDASAIGKPVSMPTLTEEMSDEIPF
jgi:hypothetical protein